MMRSHYSILALVIVTVSLAYNYTNTIHFNKSFKKISRVVAKRNTTSAKVSNLNTKATSEKSIVRSVANVEKTAGSNLNAILKQYSDGQWNFDLQNEKPYYIYGAKTKPELTNDDSKLQAFASDLASALVPNSSTLILDSTKTNTNSLETINDFNQRIDNIEVYNSYLRTFRNTKNYEITFVINELTPYNEIESRQLFNDQDAEHKLKTYFAPFGKEFEVNGCNKLVYFITNLKIAQLSYVCDVVVYDTVPVVKEVVVSANSLEVLQQNSKTIIN